jgi:hypothetical protein
LTRDASVFKVKEHSDPTETNNNKVNPSIDQYKTTQIFGQGGAYNGTTNDELRKLFDEQKVKIKEKFGL